MNLRQYANKVNSFDFDKEYVEIINENAGLIVAINQSMLMEGKTSENKDIRPYYSEDLKSRGGYFKSNKSALRYAAWKRKDSPSPKRKIDVPNLFISLGVHHFHDEFKLNVKGTEFFVKGEGYMSSKVEPKYEHIHTMTDEDALDFGSGIIAPQILRKFKSILGND